jgi:hypothetical protein
MFTGIILLICSTVKFFFMISREMPFIESELSLSAEISFAVPKMKVFVFRSVDAQKEVFPTELTLKYTVSKVRRTQN